MDKKEVFDYINSGVDKSGSLKKVSGFRLHYPELYDEFLKVDFPDDIKNLPFKQQLWHFLNDDYSIPVCKICGSSVSFLTRKGQWGYSTYCSGACAMKDDVVKEKLDNTKLERHGDKHYNNIEKQKETISLKDESYWDEKHRKSIETRHNKNDGRYFSAESICKIRETNLKKYGVDSFAKTEEFRNIIKDKHDDIQEKQYLTKKENKSFNASGIEDLFSEYLYELNIDHVRQYKSDLYPYSCDFFLKDLEIYIEIQGSWTHGHHPYDSNNKDDIDKVELWKSKNTKYYDNAIYTWTDLDVRKRQIARDNGLNYLEIFSDDYFECVKIFEDYVKDMIVEYCMSKELPGTNKWSNNHPIWDCKVGNRLSPREGWNDINCVRSAVSNMFKMIHNDNDFKIKHIHEINQCIIENNHIVDCKGKLLEKVLNRFTIAKIAPKVTALSENTMKKMIYDSGIDISKGVYVPMAGFGGIVRAAKKWGEEHGVNVECETYDINQNFCSYYGWTQKDMLSDIVVTDKVCLCCPPFGKKYEHWKGTPNEMSDIDFKDWYRLIKEHVIAPEYIIIGPEIDKTGTGSNKGLDKKGNRINGLFVKTVGVMVWDDEMIKKENT